MKVPEKYLNLWTFKGQWLIVLRVGLGISLFIRGISFMRTRTLIDHLLSQSTILKEFGWLSVPITWVHLFCGLLILLGLFTRFAILLQIPILIGGLIVTNIQEGVFSFDPEVGFGFIILLLLLFFLIEGSGPWSFDKLMLNRKD
jgi:uncharacterized membrane protein YphA (DoxX/SURF4 family)